MTRISAAWAVMALVSCLSFPAFPNPPSADASCAAGGEQDAGPGERLGDGSIVSSNVVGYVRKGADTILLSCPARPDDPFPCTCHAPPDAAGKCRVYACNANAEPAPPGAKTADEPQAVGRPSFDTGQSPGAQAPDGKPAQAPNGEPAQPARAQPKPGIIDAGEAERDARDAEAAKQAAGFAPQFRRLLRMAQTGDARAQFNLGYLYIVGYGNEPPLGRPEMSAQERYAGQKRISGPLPEGARLKRDFAEGIKWYRRAASQGVPEAQYDVGEMYRYGRGTPPNAEEAYFWLSLAAKSGRWELADNADFLANPGLSPEALARQRKRLDEWRVLPESEGGRPPPLQLPPARPPAPPPQP